MDRACSAHAAIHWNLACAFANLLGAIKQFLFALGAIVEAGAIGAKAGSAVFGCV